MLEVPVVRCLTSQSFAGWKAYPRRQWSIVGCFTNPDTRLLGRGPMRDEISRPAALRLRKPSLRSWGSMPRVGEGPRDRRDSIGARSCDDRTGPRPFTWASRPTMKLPDAPSRLLLMSRMRRFEFQTCRRLDARLAQ